MPTILPEVSTTPAPQAASPSRTGSGSEHRWTGFPLGAIALLTPLVLLVHGYHPFADDGAVYVSGIRKLLDRRLYQPDAVFVLSHTRFSIFSHLLAGLVRLTHLPLSGILLLCHLASIFLFLLGAWAVAERIFTDNASRWGALLLAACCFTLPAAGTSLSLMDPYVTARSFSTPLGLFALAAVLGDGWLEAAFWLLCMAAFHPFMACFSMIFLLALALVRHGRWTLLTSLCGLGVLASAVIYLLTRSASLDSAASRAALSRSYFFLSSWEWYEIAGLIFPLVLFGAAAWRSRNKGPLGSLSATAAITGSCALLIALCFVHRSGSLLLARVQVLRIFQILYVTGALLCGGLLGRMAGNSGPKRTWAIGAVFLALAFAMFGGQRLTYSSSAHIEWPGATPRNAWRQAFLWVRANTPQNAVFAMDADYIGIPGEDAQGFRATAERSTIADWYKDGGVASVFPAAQEIWWKQVQATTGLNRATDAERIARLTPFGVTWILLPLETKTDLPCPYANRAVKVCRLSGFA